MIFVVFFFAAILVVAVQLVRTGMGRYGCTHIGIIVAFDRVAYLLESFLCLHFFFLLLSLGVRSIITAAMTLTTDRIEDRTVVLYKF